MAATVNVNGQTFDQDHAVISVFDHGFLYGEGVYETLRTYHGKPFLFERHMRRLRRSAGMIDLPIPLTDDEIARRFTETQRAAHLEGDVPEREAYIRILITRGVGDLTYDPAATPHSSVVIIVKPHVQLPEDVYNAGVPVSIVPIVRNHPQTVNPMIKSNNLLNNALAAQHAVREKAFEGIMRNHRGELAECSTSNLFIVRNGTVLTPPEKAPGDVALEVRGLSVKSLNPFGTSLKDISFTVRKGEVLGIGGVAGNGQDELLLALSGEVRSVPGAVRVKGDNAGHLGPNERRLAGLVTGPEERLGHAAAPDMSLAENALLSGALRKGLAKNGFIDWPSVRTWAEKIVSTFDVRTPGIGTAARALSGGNLQKFVIGREIMQDPDVIIVNQPTWGVDAAAAAFIRQALLDRAAAGAAVVVISQDIDELLETGDRFAALNEGRLSDPVPTKGLTVDQIGLMLGGAHGMHKAEVHHAEA